MIVITRGERRERAREQRRAKTNKEGERDQGTMSRKAEDSCATRQILSKCTGNKNSCVWSCSTFCTDDSCGMNIDCLRIRIV